MKIIRKGGRFSLWIGALVVTAFVTGCSSDNNSTTTTPTDTPTDPAALTVVSTNPDDGATAIATNQSVMATFSEAMDETTLDDTSFTVQGDNEPATVGSVTLDDASNTAVFTPTSDLSASTDYTATLTTAATSSSGKTMASDYVWSFATGTATDDASPTVSSTEPADNTTDFYLNRNITATFSESLNPATVDASSFTVEETTSGTVVAGVVSYNDAVMQATFNPDSNLSASVDYTATLTTGVEDLAGNALAANYVWSFSGVEVSPTLSPVDLGTAADFTILAKTGISKTGTSGTMITGDIGVSPEALSAITGFSETLDASGTYATSPYVTGGIYAANLADPTPTKMTTAVSDMETAYSDAAGRTLPDFTELGAGNVTGMTLEPGLYKWGTNVLINEAGVTLSGSSTDVWIFQIAGDLIVDNAASVTLAGGALPENIFWQVEGGTGVSIGTTAEFSGVVLAQKAITVNTGATINGRLLAQSAVTLDSNAVTEP
ncbi:MAG: ice-binding family protein [Pseudomonadota bacterium]